VEGLMISAGIQAGLSALDTFLLGRVGEGWRLNMFVDGPLKEFLEDNPG
jgi:hypothetical protein